MSEGAVAIIARPGLVTELATKYGLDRDNFYNTVAKQLFPATTRYPNPPTKEEMIMFLTICNEYDLNPFLGEIYPIRTQGGAIKAYIPIDGWITMVQRRKEYEGNEFIEVINPDTKQLTAVTCRIFRSDRHRHTEMTEYMEECRRDSDPWKNWPRRMLHHKAFIQAARYAFGFSAIMDEDDADRMINVTPNVQSYQPPAQPKRMPQQAESVADREVPAGEQAREPEKVPAQPARQPAQQSTLMDQQTEEDSPISTDDLSKIMKAAYDTGWTKQEIQAFFKKTMKVDDPKQLRRSQVAEVISNIQAGRA